MNGYLLTHQESSAWESVIGFLELCLSNRSFSLTSFCYELKGLVKYLDCKHRVKGYKIITCDKKKDSLGSSSLAMANTFYCI